MTTNDETKKPLAIRILEGLAEQFAAGRREASLAPFPPTSSENEREAIRMQRQGRGEAWWGAEVAVQEALERNREALEASASGLIAAAVVKRLDEQAAVISEQRQTIDAHIEHIRILREGQDAAALAQQNTERLLEEARARLEVEKRAHALTMDQLATAREDLAVEKRAMATARQIASDLREERDGRGKRIEHLAGDLEKAQAAIRYASEALGVLRELAENVERWDIDVLISEVDKLKAAREYIVKLEAELAETRAHRNRLMAEEASVGLELRGVYARLETAERLRDEQVAEPIAAGSPIMALPVAQYSAILDRIAKLESGQPEWNVRDRLHTLERANESLRDRVTTLEQVAHAEAKKLSRVAEEVERLAEVGARTDRELLGRVLKLEQDRATRADLHMIERAFSGRCQTLEERVGLEKDRINTLSAAVREEQQRLDEEAEHRRTLAECVKALQMQSDPARRPL